MSLEQAGNALYGISNFVKGLQSRLFMEVVMPLAQETLAKLNTMSGMHTEDAAKLYGQYILTPETHKVIDICDNLVVENIGFGPGVFPLDYFDDNKSIYGGGLSHKNCHCKLVPLSTATYQMEVEANQWKIQATANGIVFINESEKVNRQIQGWGAQLTGDGKVSDIGKEPDTFAETIISEFEVLLEQRIQEFINKAIQGYIK